MPYAATIMALPVTAVGCDAGPRSGRRIPAERRPHLQGLV